MAERYIVGDTVELTNTWTVNGTPTDPDTVSLKVTDPDGTATTYNYPADIIKVSTGVYQRTLATVALPGTWLYLWTGTGAAADVADGYFEVYAVVAPDTLDVLTFGEAKDALQQQQSGGTRYDHVIRQWVTAVSRRMDELVGPVVVRTITDELHDGGAYAIAPRHTPVATVTTVTEYQGTAGTVLTAEDNSTKPAAGYLLDDQGGHFQLIRRRSADQDTPFVVGRRNVEVTYTAGRYATTESVDARFKVAAGEALRRLWQREMGAWARGGNPFGEEDGGLTPLGFFRAVDPPIEELLPDDVRVTA